MNCYFKSIDTFLTYGQAVVHEYEVPIMTADGTHGTVTVTGELSQDYTGDWLVLDGHLLYIVSVAPENNMTSIVVGDPFTAFSRTVAYVEPSSYYLGEYIKEFAESEYINQPDPFFDMPYLTVTNSDTTEFAHVAPNDGLTSLETVIRGAMERGVAIAVSFDENTMTLAVSTGTTTRKTVVLGDGHSELFEETYNRQFISKVTVISELGYPHVYYMTLTGEITTEPPVNRPRGEWVTVQQGADNLLDTAKGAFAASIDSHKIAFYSTLELPLSCPLLVRLKDKTYETMVTYIGVQSYDNRVMYQCGEAISTLTGRVAEIGRAVAQAASSIPSALSQLANDVGYITSEGTAAKVAHALTMMVPEGTNKTFDGSAATTLSIRDLVYLGNQPITTTTNDTPYNWAQFGTGIAYYGTEGMLNGQPEQYGLVLNFATNTAVMHQLFLGIYNNVYTRHGNGSSASNAWSAWQRLLEPGDAYYKAGDTYSIGGYTPIPCIYYSGSHRVYMNITVPKSLANITTVTATALKGGLTGPTGQMDGSGDNTDWLNSSSYSVAVTKQSDNTVRIIMTKSSAISGISTNVVCALDANPITLSFS